MNRRQLDMLLVAVVIIGCAIALGLVVLSDPRLH